MNVSLKAVRIAKHLSEETTAFTATLYVDDKRIGQIRNGGTGGPNEYHYDCRTSGDEFESHAKQMFPDTFEPEDELVGELLDDYERQQWFKRQRKRSLLFRIEGDEVDDFRTIPLAATKKRPVPVSRDAAVKHVTDKYGDKVIEIH